MIMVATWEIGLEITYKQAILNKLSLTNNFGRRVDSSS